MKKLDRRTVLRGAGGIAIALPWLEAMGPQETLAQASGDAPKRFVSVYTPGGSVKRDGGDDKTQNRWSPSGSGNNLTLSPILEPLESVKQKMVFLDGVGMPSAQGEQHQAGIIALLTGTEQGQTGQFAKGPSIDQVIASRISRGIKRFASYEMAIRWATGKSHGKLHAINSLNFDDSEGASPIPPRLDPVHIYTELFSDVHVDPNSQAAIASAQRLARRKSVLDFVGKRYETLSTRIGQSDRIKMDLHLEKVREIERALSLTVPESAMNICDPQPLPDLTGYSPQPCGNDEVVRCGNNGVDGNGMSRASAAEASADAVIPQVGKAFMDMMVMAMACDLTAVTTLQWTDTEAKHTFPWLEVDGDPLLLHHHHYQHDSGFQPIHCEVIYRWYSEQHAYLLESMDSIDMGGHSLLDESVVFFGSELGHPPDHNKEDVPFMLAGGGASLPGGRHLSFEQNTSHTALLVSLLNLFGDERNQFGDPGYGSGALPGLI